MNDFAPSTQRTGRSQITGDVELLTYIRRLARSGSVPPPFRHSKPRLPSAYAASFACAVCRERTPCCTFGPGTKIGTASEGIAANGHAGSSLPLPPRLPEDNCRMRILSHPQVRRCPFGRLLRSASSTRSSSGAPLHLRTCTAVCSQGF